MAYPFFRVERGMPPLYTTKIESSHEPLSIEYAYESMTEKL